MHWLPNQLPVNYRLLLAFTVPLVIWVAVSAACIIAVEYVQSRYAEISEARETVALASEFRGIIDDLRDEERAYLLTSNTAALDAHREGIRRANQLYDQLAWRSRDEPRQMERLQEAGEILQRWFYDFSSRRIKARERVPFSRVQNLQQLQYHLLAIESALSMGNKPDMGAHVDPLRRALAHLRTDASRGNGHERLTRATANFDEFEDHLRQNNLSSAADAIHAMTNQLMPAFAEVMEEENRLFENVRASTGPQLVTEFNETMGNFVRFEQDLIETGRTSALKAGSFIHWTIWSGLIAGILLMLLVLFWFARRLGDSVESIDHAAEELAKGNLAARIPVGKEASRLAERFNHMAELLEKRHQQAKLLSDLGETLHNCRDISEALEVFGRFAGTLFPDHGGVLYLIEPNGNDVTAVASWHGGEACSDRLFATGQCWGLRLGRIHENGIGGNVNCDHIHGGNVNSLCVPLPAFGEIIGLIFITVDFEHEDASERERHRQFVDTVAEQVALALANVKLREELRNQSIRDSLTHLYNRRHMDDVMTRELHRAERHGAPLAVLAFDIDRFKPYNDEHGHDGGDAVLRALGETLRDFFRPEDGIFRSGGEEFVTILPGTTHENALQRAEELREAVSRMKILKGNLHLPPVTISVGVATYPEHGLDEAALLKQADLALYEAKHKGRNRVESAGA